TSEIDLAHPRDGGGHCAHQHTRRVECLPARRVDPDSFERRHPARQGYAVGAVLEAPEPLTLLLVVATNALGGELERGPHRGSQALEGSPATELSDEESLGAPPFEALDVARKSGVLLAADGVEHLA